VTSPSERDVSPRSRRFFLAEDVDISSRWRVEEVGRLPQFEGDSSQFATVSSQCRRRSLFSVERSWGVGILFAVEACGDEEVMLPLRKDDVPPAERRCRSFGKIMFLMERHCPLWKDNDAYAEI